jgi:hypothetical protein
MYSQLSPDPCQTMEPMPILYVFWHHAAVHVATSDYEARLLHFRQALNEVDAAASGLSAPATSYALDAMPWLESASRICIDLYALPNTAAMELLNHAAVHGPLTEPHAAIARLYGAGLGSLYQLQLGALQPQGLSHSYWLRKPHGLTYESLYAMLTPLMPANAFLARRMMVLGASMEFALFSPTPIALPTEWSPLHRTLTSIV